MTLDNVRQPKPVQITISGEREDVEKYLHIIRKAVESRGYDNVLVKHLPPREVTIGAIIYPGAVNE